MAIDTMTLAMTSANLPGLSVRVAARPAAVIVTRGLGAL
jgi:hypothetical protein